jgi:pimeloyl-ACP methyl ester carboxylesterase
MMRKSFVTAAATAIAAASQLPLVGKTAPSVDPSTTARFDSLQQIDAGELSVAYADLGPRNGKPVILLHGWPYDIHSYGEVAIRLVSRGYRVVVPYLRGFGPTRFLSRDTFRNGEQAAFAFDTIALMDALRIDRAIVGGFDWGSRSADIMAALWPDRCAGLVSVSGYLITNLAANSEPLPPKAELGWWYQYYFSTERGRSGYEKYRHDFNKLIWRTASPTWNFADATYEQTALAFDNPDHVDIVIHNYRWRLGLAKGDPKLEPAEEQLQQTPVIRIPAITIASDFVGSYVPPELVVASCTPMSRACGN